MPLSYVRHDQYGKVKKIDKLTDVQKVSPYHHPVTMLWTRVGTIGQSGDSLILFVCPLCGVGCADAIKHYNYHKARHEKL